MVIVLTAAADVSDDMSHRYWHIRHELRSVRPEVYKATHILNSDYHMSLSQIQGAFVEIRLIFGQDWKPYKNRTIDNEAFL